MAVMLIQFSSNNMGGKNPLAIDTFQSQNIINSAT